MSELQFQYMENLRDHRVQIVHVPHHPLLDERLEVVARCADLAEAITLMECLKHDG
jgi:hypothetical protein